VYSSGLRGRYATSTAPQMCSSRRN
jgi:hypothetical protein